MNKLRWKKRPGGSNWGDYGVDDQVGRMNEITPAVRRKAAQEIREGIAFCLSLPLDYPGGNKLFSLRKPPQFFYERRGDQHNFNFPLSQVEPQFNDVISDDAVLLSTQYSTQWDALGHVGQCFDADEDGTAEMVYYNGYRAHADVVGPENASMPPGAHRLGIENLASAGVQGRGVLVDLERIYGRTRTLVGYEQLMRAIDAMKGPVEPGDFLCLYTGFSDLILEMQKNPVEEVLKGSCAVLDGRDERLLQWITDSGIAAICADNFAVEAYPSQVGCGDHYPALPLHNHCLFKLGIHLGELWHFGEIAKWLRDNDRSAFFLTAPPLRLPGAVGSPVTPVGTV